jgi:outer membrane receptor protein involved in Fe transport
LNLNLRYDFSQSRLALDRFNGLQAFLNITNVGDRIPNFFSGTGAGGINTTFFSGLGRQYEIGVEMSF